MVANYCLPNTAHHHAPLLAVSHVLAHHTARATHVTHLSTPHTLHHTVQHTQYNTDAGTHARMYVRTPQYIMEEPTTVLSCALSLQQRVPQKETRVATAESYSLLRLREHRHDQRSSLSDYDEHYLEMSQP